MRAEDKFHPDAVAEMRRELAEADSPDSVEVLWIGRVDGEGIVVAVSAAARGDATMVPALFPHMSRGDAVIHNHPGGDLRPSGADLNVASRLGNAGIGFMIVNDDVTQVNVVAAPIPKQELIPLDVEGLSSVLEPDGILSSHMDGYEARWEQIDLLQMVAMSFNTGTPVVAEAGTGVGKSFAYLIPALRWAADNDERVVISTATIALQQQLMEKDIPFVIDLLGADVKVALVKGRGNYLCLKRLEESSEDNELFTTGDGLEGLAAWAAVTATGSRSDIPFKPAESDWGRVRCEADNCPGSFCRLFDKCFLMKARRRAAESSVLVANHHLLFADLAARRDGAGPDETVVLPPYRRIILDEAHHAESSATDLFSASISLPAFQRIFTRLLRKKGHAARGLLPRLADRFPLSSEVFIGEIPPLIEAARGKAETLDALGRDLLGGAGQVRLKGEPGELEKARLGEPMNALRKALADLVGCLADAIRDLAEDDADPEVEALAVEARQTCAVLQEAVGVTDAFLHRDEYPDQVFWLESFRRSDGNQWLACHKTPLSIANVVREAVWEPFHTVVGLSATLAVGGDFHHWKSRIGAERITREPLEGIFPSPFDYASRVFLGIPADAPSPEQPEEWEAFLVEAVASAVDLSGGHALILFTAYSTLRKTLAGVRAKLPPGGPLLLAQGDDDRGRLLKRFREETSSVLFATDSFWEGVDVPGEALKLVIITRLPFRPPTDPVAEARREALAAAGGNPFFQLTLPEAVTRFRQGFGRLMRRSDDRGAVLVLDPRVVRKQYGSLFLDSLPQTSRSIKPLEGVLRDLEDFLFSQ